MVVGLAAPAPWYYTKTGPDMSAYSSIVGGNVCVVDMVDIPTEGIVFPVVLSELYVSVQKFQLEG